MRTRRIRRDFRLVGVYAIFNRSNGKVYVGSSTNLIGRIDMHEKQLISGSHPNRMMKADFDKNDHFVFDILYVRSVGRIGEGAKMSRSDRQDLYAREWEYIEHFNSLQQGYNRQPISTLHRFAKREERK